MIIVQIIGGLGNQMFQYAIGRALSISNNSTLKLDITPFDTVEARKFELNVFNLPINLADDIEIKKLKGSKISAALRRRGLISSSVNFYHEKHPWFDKDVLHYNPPIYLEGYWQSEKYFEKYTDIIRQDFIFKTELDDRNSKLITKIRSENSIAIHVRRGDYVTKSRVAVYHGICPVNYYTTAIEYMVKNEKNLRFYIFSDDPIWAKKNIVIQNYPVIYINHNKEENSFNDLRLMSACKHHIIANSSFSWWGAWLAEWSGQRVIAPKQWFKMSRTDIVPGRWLKL